MTNLMKTIANVGQTLNLIEVKGKQNLLMLGGCLDALEKVLKELSEAEGNTAPSDDAIEM